RVVDQISLLKMEAMRSEVSQFEGRIAIETLLHGKAPLLDVLRGRMSLHRGIADSGLTQHGRTEVKALIRPRINDGWRRSEIIALLRFRENIWNVVPLVAPRVHIHRCKEDSEGRVQDQSHVRNRLREAEARREIMRIRILQTLGIPVLSTNKYGGHAVIEDEI